MLPVVPRRADHPGRKRLADRKVLCGILFVLNTGIAWEFLPQEPGNDVPVSFRLPTTPGVMAAGTGAVMTAAPEAYCGR